MNNAQAEDIDRNRNGTPDLLNRDRNGGTLLPFIYSGQDDRFGCVCRPEFASRFPALVDWVKIRDSNREWGSVYRPCTGCSGYSGVPGMDTVCALANLDDVQRLELICGNQLGGLMVYESSFLEAGTTPIKGKENDGPTITLFPNPINCGKTVQLRLRENTNGNILLTDLWGRTHARKCYKSGLTSLETSGLFPGIYLLILEVQGSRWSRKIVIR